MLEETIYTGELDLELYEVFSEVLEDEFPTEWIDAEIEVILEPNEQYNITVKGPETTNLIPFTKNHGPQESYTLDEEDTQYLRELL